MSVWDGPHALAFMQGICDRLRGGHEHCVIMMPAPLQAAFLKKFLVWLEFRLGTVRVFSPGPDDDLLRQLGPEFCSGEMPTSCAELASLQTRDNAILLFRCQEAGISEQVSQLALGAKEKARYCKNANTPLPCSMIWLAAPGCQLPAEDVGFSWHYWWGKLRESDLEFVIESELDSLNPGLPAWRWLYSLCKGLCQGAPDVVAWIARNSPASFEDILSLLRKHPFCTRQNGELARAILQEAAAPAGSGNPPAGARLRAWASGIFELWTQGHELIHPAALLAAGREDLLIRRIWHGQIQVYFPLVQDAINLLRGCLEQKLGRGWQNGQEIQEIGGLLYFINNCKSEEADLKMEQELAHLWWHIRTSLAHHSPVTMDLALLAAHLLEKMRCLQRE